MTSNIEEILIVEHSGQSAADVVSKNALIAAARRGILRFDDRSVSGGANSDFKVSYYNITVSLSTGGSLLFNSRSRGMVFLTPQETEIVAALTAKPSFNRNEVKNAVFLKSLQNSGFIVLSNLNELGSVEIDYKSNRGDKNSLSLTIAPTMACNFGCSYCFQGLIKSTKKMGNEVQEAIIEFVKSYGDIKHLSIAWYGGEPLMGRDSIYRLSDKLIAWCDKKGINYSASMVTNAYFLTSEVAAQLHSRRVRHVQITIDGDKETHDKMRPLTSGRGTYDTIVSNIADALRETPLSISTRVNVGSRNVDRAHAMLDEMDAKGFAKSGNFSVYFASIEASTPESGTASAEGLAKADFNKAILGLEDRARKLGMSQTVKAPDSFMGMCVAAFENGYVISGSGDVHKCWENAHDETKRTGTIFEPEKLLESVNAKLYNQWSPFDNEICTSCKIMPMCGGHCAHRFIYGGVDDNALPCPSWKWNTAEYLFSRAKDLGVVTDDMWQEDQSTIFAKQSGERQTPESLKRSQTILLEKVSAQVGRVIDAEMLQVGEPALQPGSSMRPFEETLARQLAGENVM